MKEYDVVYPLEYDRMCRIAAVVRRLYSEMYMDGDTMRNAAQMLHTILTDHDEEGLLYKPHATYDSQLK